MKSCLKIFFLLLLVQSIAAQEVDIIPELKNIESGKIDAAKRNTAKLLRQNPDNPDVLFLDAVLTRDGKKAAGKYEYIFETYPNSTYADASLYRVFSYYFSLGAYNKAQNLLDNLRENYPGSPYLQFADRNIPEEDIQFDYQETEPKNESKVVTKPVQKKKGKIYRFTVQAGAFLNIENAQSLHEKFNDNGHPSRLFTKQVGGSLLNIVTVGKFADYKEAENFLPKLKNTYNLIGRVIKLNE